MSRPTQDETLVELRAELARKLASNKGTYFLAVHKGLNIPDSLPNRIARYTRYLEALDAAVEYINHNEQGHLQGKELEEF